MSSSQHVIRWFVFLLFLTLGITTVQAQKLTPIYSGLNQATSLDVTQNAVYIVEQGKNRVLKLDHSGKLLEAIGGKGLGNYQFSKPVDVDATNGLKVFISDYDNRRVQVFDRRGQYLSSISASEAFGNNRPYLPTQIAVDNLGELIFVDEEENYIRRFDMDSNLLDEFRIPPEVQSIDDFSTISGKVLILDEEASVIHELDLNGRYLRFLPAEGVKAIHPTPEGIWTARDGLIQFASQKGTDSEILRFDGSISPVGIHYEDQVVYMLTSSALYKIMIAAE